MPTIADKPSRPIISQAAAWALYEAAEKSVECVDSATRCSTATAMLANLKVADNVAKHALARVEAEIEEGGG